MNKYLIIGITGFILLGLFSPGFSQETLTITTYYPSPYGSYREVSAYRMKIGTTYSNLTVANNTLIVEGNVGLGTPTPREKLTVVGNIWATNGVLYTKTFHPACGAWYCGGAEINLGGNSGSKINLLDAYNKRISADPNELTIGNEEVGNWNTVTTMRIDTGASSRFRVTNDIGNEWFAVKGNNGYVGIGTATPTSKLNVAGGTVLITGAAAGTAALYVDLGDIALRGGLMGNSGIRFFSDGDTNHRIYYAGSTNSLHFDSYAPMYFNQGLITPGRVGIGTNTPQGALDVNGFVYANQYWVRGTAIHYPDYVFEPAYKLESIEEHSEYMWKHKQLKGVPEVAKDEAGNNKMELGGQSLGVLEELEKAHVYIQQLNERIKTLEAKIAQGK